MKCILVVCLLALVALSVADTEADLRGCRHINGKCVEDCPVGTHAYTLGCGYLTPEATCEEPNPAVTNGIICDYSSCYCNPGTVRDEKVNKCVPLDQCTKEEKEHEHSNE